jgi:hypothetical protein
MTGRIPSFIVTPLTMATPIINTICSWTRLISGALLVQIKNNLAALTAIVCVYRILDRKLNAPGFVFPCGHSPGFFLLGKGKIDLDPGALIPGNYNVALQLVGDQIVHQL